MVKVYALNRKLKMQKPAENPSIDANGHVH